MDIQEIMIQINQLEIISRQLNEEYKKITNDTDKDKMSKVITKVGSRIVELERKHQLEEYKQFKDNEPPIDVDFLAQGIEENRKYGKEQIEIALQKLDGNYIEIDGQNIREIDYDNRTGISSIGMNNDFQFPVTEEYVNIR